MAWRLAKSLDTLRAQVNSAYPGRSKSSDGTLGDAAHSARMSDHNPDSRGVVRALDLTHDPAHGFDAHALADRMRLSADPRIKYLISNGRIWNPKVSPDWRTYTGANPHDRHMHTSVVADVRADDPRPWSAVTAAGDMQPPAQLEEVDEDMAQIIPNYKPDGALHYFYVADGGDLYHAWWPRSGKTGRQAEDLGAKFPGYPSTFDGQPSVHVDSATDNKIHVVCDRKGSNPPAHFFYTPGKTWAVD